MMDGTMRRVCLPGCAFLALLIAGCTSATAPNATTSAGLSSPMASPSAAAGRVLFSGTYDCGFPDGLEEVRDGEITTYTGTIACTLETTDSRANGDEVGEITMAHLKRPGYEINKWRGSGTGSITNAGGSWRGVEAFGADVWDEAGRTTTTGTAAYVGEDGYAGLRMRTLFAQGTNEGVDAYIIVGWIEPEG